MKTWKTKTINEKVRPDAHEDRIRKLPRLLKRYENKEFELQQRAQFLYYLMFGLLLCIAIIVLYTYYLYYDKGSSSN
ncbi:MAG TPA: hypothetical protein PLP69_07325, partial [Bacteroidales bacterium]|nr:hypothetical protein [Bacteroidales bacterium]